MGESRGPFPWALIAFYALLAGGLMLAALLLLKAAL